MKLKKLLNWTQIVLALLSLLVFFIGNNSNYLAPLYIADKPFNIDFNFGFFFITSAVLNFFCRRFGIWWSLFVCVKYLPLNIYQFFVAADSSLLIKRLVLLSFILLLLTIMATIIHLFAKSEKLNSEIFKRKASRLKLSSFKYGRCFNYLVNGLGIMTFIFITTFIILSLAAMTQVNYVEGVIAQEYWFIFMAIFFIPLTLTAYLRIKFLKLRRLFLTHSLLFIMLAILTPVLIQTYQIAQMTAFYKLMVMVNLLLAFTLLGLQILELIAFDIMQYRYRAQVVLPEFSEKMIWPIWKQVIYWIAQIILIIAVVLEWQGVAMQPIAESTIKIGLINQFKNTPIISSSNNKIVIKNITFQDDK